MGGSPSGCVSFVCTGICLTVVSCRPFGSCTGALIGDIDFWTAASMAAGCLSVNPKSGCFVEISTGRVFGISDEWKPDCVPRSFAGTCGIPFGFAPPIEFMLGLPEMPPLMLTVDGLFIPAGFPLMLEPLLYG